MLNKLAINNQLLKKKKVVQQARIQIVNRLVQKIRKTKVLTEKHTENNKLKKKLNNQLEILTHIKKFNRFEVLKNAVLNQTDPTAILTNGSVKPEQKALAHFYQHPLVKEAVKSIREQFHLKTGDTSWQKELRELGKKKKKEKSKEKTAAVEAKGLEWIEEDIVEEPSTEKNAINNLNNKKPKNSNKNLLKTNKQEQKKSNATTKKEEPLEEKIPVQQSVDPFFITSQGDNYLATAVKETVNTQNFDENQTRTKVVFQKSGNFKNKFDKKQSGNSKSKDKFGGNNKKDTKFKKVFDDKKPWEKTKRMPESTEGLHPSWAAKQKLNPVIKKFAGKKTVFDDETVSLNKNSLKVTKSPAETDEALHPSWAAKQKLKPVITEFKGKKIVFDDD